MGDELNNIQINKKKGTIKILINPKIYPLDVVMSAAYVLTEEYYMILDGDPTEKLTVEIKPKKKTQDLEEVGRIFNNELITYASYAIQELKNKGIREAIIERVLLTHSDYEDEEPHDYREDYCDSDEEWELEDRNDIAASWDEKVGDDPKSGSDDEKWEIDDPEGIAVPWEEKYGKSEGKEQ